MNVSDCWVTKLDKWKCFHVSVCTISSKYWNIGWARITIAAWLLLRDIHKSPSENYESWDGRASSLIILILNFKSWVEAISSYNYILLLDQSGSSSKFKTCWEGWSIIRTSSKDDQRKSKLVSEGSRYETRANIKNRLWRTWVEGPFTFSDFAPWGRERRYYGSQVIATSDVFVEICKIAQGRCKQLLRRLLRCTFMYENWRNTRNSSPVAKTYISALRLVPLAACDNESNCTPPNSDAPFKSFMVRVDGDQGSDYLLTNLTSTMQELTLRSSFCCSDIDLPAVSPWPPHSCPKVLEP